MCWFCGENPEGISKVSRNDVCPKCGRDLKVCKNCRFFCPGAYNDCNESQAERVMDKEKSNFCEYFVYSETASDKAGNKPADSKSAFNALFND